MTNIKETLLIEVRTEFEHQRLGTDGFFETRKVLTWMEVLHKDVLNRSVDKMTGYIRGIGGGDIDGSYPKSITTNQ